MAIYSFSHRTIGRSTHEAGTASAHMRYITRPNECAHVYSERMPLNKHAAVRWMDNHEEGLRKNGRVCDKFVIALPVELALQENVELVRDFGFQLSNGRAPFFAAFHDMEGHNPHCHFVFMDKDIGTGKRVRQMSEKGSTELVRKIWEDTANKHLEMNGHDVTIDRRTLEAQGIDREPEEHRGIEEHANDNDVEHPMDEYTLEDRAFDVEVDELIDEDDAYFDKMKDALEKPSLESRLNRFKETKAEWDYLKHQRSEIERLREELPIREKHASASRNLLEEQTAKTANREGDFLKAKETLRDYQKDNGQLKGWATPKFLKIIGLEYSSPKRRDALSALSIAERREAALGMAKESLNEKKSIYNEAHSIKEGVQTKLMTLEIRLAAIGTEEELKEADKIYETSLDYAVDCLPEEELDAADISQNLREKIEEHRKIMEEREIEEDISY